MISPEEKAEYNNIFLTGLNTEDAVKRTIREACETGRAKPHHIFFYESSGPHGYMCNVYRADQRIARCLREDISKGIWKVSRK